MSKWPVFRRPTAGMLLLVAMLVANPARAGTALEAALDRAAALAGLPRAVLVPDLRAATQMPSDAPAPPALLRLLQARPLNAPTWARALRADLAAEAGRPVQPLAQAAALYAQSPVVSPMPVDEASSSAGGDPLVDALRRLWRLAGQTWPADPPLPMDLHLHRPLRAAVADMLQAIVDAETARRRALASVPSALTPTLLVAQLSGEGSPAGEALLRRAVSLVDRVALAQGLQRLAEATEALARALPGLADHARVDWTWSTPWGDVRIDTTGTDGVHVLRDPLLVVDVGGNDRYRFASRSARNRIAVLLDIGGNDRYEAEAPAVDAAAGVLGYGLLWDAEGDDAYVGGWLAQGAAVFGGSFLLDGGGNDRYQATGLAQGYALAGLTLLIERGGDDRYTAATHAQASAGPGGVALLLDASGDDRYRLAAEPVVARSAQLPDRNTSMGQGAGRGWPAEGDAPALAGGVGLLVDLAGDDVYSGQVFTQGAGYYFGVGMLVDGGGNDRFDAAWYAMAAAAHGGAGVLLKEGQGNDRYSVSHSTSLGAAQDRALAYFRDDGGNDHYRLGDLGLGAGQDLGVAVFVDAAGDDDYVSGGCHVLGVARFSDAKDPAVGAMRGAGLFFDLRGGADRYPSQCPMARDGGAWVMDGPAGAAAGLDAP